MTETSISAYQFLIETIPKLSDAEHPVVLDFGCGKARLVSMGLAQGLDIWGADNFSYRDEWKPKAEAAGGNRVLDIQDGVLPFSDCHFDVVIANMVFEHVHDPVPALQEIARVLKPRGRFLALFPVQETWFEGHLGLYFPHWFSGYPRIQRTYMTLLYRLGFGFRRSSFGDWVTTRQRDLGTSIVYHREADVRAWWETAFGNAPKDLSQAYMRARLPRLTFLPDWLLSAVCRRRVGLVLLTERA